MMRMSMSAEVYKLRVAGAVCADASRGPLESNGTVIRSYVEHDPFQKPASRHRIKSERRLFRQHALGHNRPVCGKVNRRYISSPALSGPGTIAVTPGSCGSS